MAWHAGLNPLQDALADLYPTGEDARRVAVQAGLSPQHIRFDGAAIDCWHNVLLDAERRGKTEQVIDVATHEYPDAEALAQALAAYRAAPKHILQDDGGESTGLFVGVPPLPDHFVGREALVDELVARLLSGESAVLSAEGKPGVGKTTLAIALARHPRVRAHFVDGILWADLGPQPDLPSLLARWADALQVDLSGYVEPKAQAQRIGDVIGTRRFLIVIDDAWQIEAARLLRFGSPNCVYILTTRDQAIARRFAGAAQVESVPELDDDSAYELLEALAPEACAVDPAATRDLASVVGGLPLAVELLGGYLGNPEHVLDETDVSPQIERLSDPRERLKLAQERLGAGATMSLQETIALSVDTLPEKARAAFYTLGAFASKPERFSRAAAEAVIASEVSGEGEAQADAVGNAFRLLVARNLVERIDGNWYALHQTIADVARTQTGGKAIRRHRDLYLGWVDEDREDWQRIETLYGQIKWAWQQQIERQPDDPGALNFLWVLRLHRERRNLWLDYVLWVPRLGRASNSEDRPLVNAATRHFVTRMLFVQGERSGALKYFEQMLSLLHVMGDLHGVAIMLYNIGRVYANQGEKENALEYYWQALPHMHTVGDRHSIAVLLYNIGRIFDDLGQKEKALEYYEQGLPLRRTTHDRQGESATRFSIAVIHAMLGDFNKAEEQLVEVVRIDEAVGSHNLESDRQVLTLVRALRQAKSEQPPSL